MVNLVFLLEGCWVTWVENWIYILIRNFQEIVWHVLSLVTAFRALREKCVLIVSIISQCFYKKAKSTIKKLIINYVFYIVLNSKLDARFFTIWYFSISEQNINLYINKKNSITSKWQKHCHVSNIDTIKTKTNVWKIELRAMLTECKL